MERTDLKRLMPRLILIAFGVCLFCLLQNFGAVLAAVRAVLDVLSPILTGLFLALVLNIPLRFLEDRLRRFPPFAHRPKCARVLSLCATLVILLALIALCLLVIVPTFVESIRLLAGSLPTSSQELSDWLGSFLGQLSVPAATIDTVRETIGNVTAEILMLLQQNTDQVASSVVDTALSLFGSVKDALLSLAVSIYVQAGREHIACFLSRVLASALPRYHGRVLRICRQFVSVFSAYLRGQIAEAVILGVMCFAGMLAFGLPHAGMVALLVSVTALIPILGAWVGGIVSALIIATVSPLQALIFIAFILILQLLETNLIFPRVVGASIGLPGLLVLCAVIVGSGFAGVPGILTGVPLAAFCYIMVKQWMELRQSKSDAPGDPSASGM